jgi:hypothetical protein
MGGLLGRMQGMRNTRKRLVVKPEWKRPRERNRCDLGNDFIFLHFSV